MKIKVSVPGQGREVIEIIANLKVAPYEIMAARPTNYVLFKQHIPSSQGSLFSGEAVYPG